MLASTTCNHLTMNDQSAVSLAGPLAGIKVVDMSVMIAGPLAAMMLGDVLIQNFRPGAMDRIGLGWDAMHELNPNLIYTSISGFGPDGPMSGRRAYDNVIQAASGLADVQTNPAKGAPELFRTLVCDKTTAYTACQAITAALFARALGKAAGQHIVLSMLDTAIAFLWPDSAMDVSLTDDDVDRAPTLASNYTTILRSSTTTSSSSESTRLPAWSVNPARQLRCRRLRSTSATMHRPSVSTLTRSSPNLGSMPQRFERRA
jgi:crotonobetainyl-CoA:carnitine CoA-transferase CaiB-like acyl-CoA transferase